MTALVVVGAQWGDEGKGKIVDLLAESADAVVRFAGGPNAGHTLVVGDEELVFRLVPSGMLHPQTQCLLGQGMVVNPAALFEEMEALSSRGIDLSGRLHLSDRAHLIMPYHLAVDALRESASTGTKIGTTKRGIGPCYEDKVGRRGVRAGDLRDLRMARDRATEALAAWTPTIKRHGAEPPSIDEVCAPLHQYAPHLVPMLVDGAKRVDEMLTSGKRILLEGAQGTLLDVDHGSYPFVTSSAAVAGGACTGAGIGPTRIDRVLGISKAYTTRVGEGPFPSELNDTAGKHLRDRGKEFGSVTGRPRRTGWLDVAALRHAKRVNGLDGLIITKLDILSGLESLKVCVGYEVEIDGMVQKTDMLPFDWRRPCKCIYETLPGWKVDIRGVRSLEALPDAARAYIRFIEEQTKLTTYALSFGPRRHEVVVLRDAFA